MINPYENRAVGIPAKPDVADQINKVFAEAEASKPFVPGTLPTPSRRVVEVGTYPSQATPGNGWETIYRKYEDGGMDTRVVPTVDGKIVPLKRLRRRMRPIQVPQA